MKPGTHPEYRPIVFRDRSTNWTLLTRSTMTSDTTIEVDGVEYPVVDVDVSSSSHPLYTGQKRIMDTAGRVEKFNRKYGRR